MGQTSSICRLSNIHVFSMSVNFPDHGFMYWRIFSLHSISPTVKIMTPLTVTSISVT